MNVAGWMSVVDGIVIWAEFFRVILDVYELTIHHLFNSIIFLLNFFLPIEIPLPPYWVLNVIIIIGTLVLAHTQASKVVWGQSVFHHILDVAVGRYRRNGLFGRGGFFSAILYGLRLVLTSPFRPIPKTDNTMKFLKSFWLVVGVISFLLFIVVTTNYQIQRHCEQSPDDWTDWLACKTSELGSRVAKRFELQVAEVLSKAEGVA